MKNILYAAGNRGGARLQLQRFLGHLDPSRYQIKIAGYRRMKMHLDWTLDALSDPFNANFISMENDNVDIYCSHIQKFNPDLIISDADLFTSYVGQVLNKPVWQVSPTLLQYITLPPKVGTAKYKILKYSGTKLDFLKNIVFNADRNYIYSHFGDCEKPPPIPANYKWMRPYHYLGGYSMACVSNIVSVLPNDATLTKLLKCEGAVIFSLQHAKHPTITTKHLGSIDEYACYLKNCVHCISGGYTDILADAFYNQKCMHIWPDLFDPECVINTLLTQYCKTGVVNFDYTLTTNNNQPPLIKYNDQIHFLHQEIDNFFGA